ncbi:MAG TPA: recombination mediator RecR [Acidisoma sp.]|jgi:recombination protein RecR|uniref:recombination mediator RecR n=1 Tax=Acidisoma sp. TaxID=1872115 RepID=UPI002CDC77E8|nr:recombination mediator RecR [Acidisoma sp.]HTI03088.1 recombination mediator RecR [Acidisoma sp.]
MGGPEIDRLVGLLAKLPGLGPRSARRAALKLLQQPDTRMLPLAQALVEAAKAVKHCHICGNLDAQDPCTICADPNRDRSLICVVEGVGDLWAIERAGAHRGLYHVLGGVLSPLGGIGPEDLNLGPLLTRLADGTVTEVILALGATVDGAATVHWLSERLAGAGVAVSRVAHGVPMGGALEVLDDGTLSTALRARRPA